MPGADGEGGGDAQGDVASKTPRRRPRLRLTSRMLLVYPVPPILRDAPFSVEPVPVPS